MQLIDLTILRGGSIARVVTFKNGLNLILDAPTASATQSGNNVGKTTCLRVIDFCLGSEGADIWTDDEFKKVNQEVFDYLHGAIEVRAVLRVCTLGKTHTLNRLFVTKGKKPPNQFLIDGIRKHSIKEYRSGIKKIAFGIDSEKPSLRELIPKFVRSSPILMGRTLKYLSAFTSEAVYEPVHLFLFGFTNVEVLALRPKLDNQKKQLVRDLETHTRRRKEGELQQLLIHLRSEVQTIEQNIPSMVEVPEISARADVIAGIRAKASRISEAFANVESEGWSIDLSIAELDSEHAGIDHKAIEIIYKEASKFLPVLHHDWVELSDFIKNLRGRKRRFLQTQRIQLSRRAEDLQEQLRHLQDQENAQLKEVSHLPDFTRAISVRAELQEKYKRLGSLEQDLEDITELRSQLDTIEKNLAITQAHITNAKDLLSKRVAVFNRYFSKLSKSLYGEEYLLHFEEKKNLIVFQLAAVGANVGTGKKMSQTAAFDLAYTRFLEDEHLPFPTFVCHDGIESIHGNQMTALLTEASEHSGQFIVATLRDKLPGLPDGFLSSNTVLELSQEDRFFKLKANVGT